MSELVVKQRPTLDLDDFERRLRQASAATHDDDPLVELARLVSEPYDPFGDVFAHEATSSQSPHGQYAADGHSAEDPDAHFGHYGAPALQPGDHAYDLPPQDGSGAGRPLFGDFAAIEAGLRGSLAHGDQSRSPNGLDSQSLHAGAPGQAGFEPEWAEHRMQPPAKTMRRPIYVMAATIAVGVIGIGAAFALKGRVATSAGEVKTIMAEAGPTKIQPPPDAATDGSSADVNAFGKGNQTSPTKVVNREEQPVDIAQAVQDNAARAAQPAAMGVTDASTVPVPPSPAQMQTAFADTQATPGSRPDLIGQQVQSFGLTGLPQPKRVHVVSVRPDGTILPNDQPPAMAAAPSYAPTKPNDHVAPLAKASTPKATPTKTSARVTATPKTIEALASADDAPPAPAAPVTSKPAKKPKPQKVASAETAPTDAAGDAPMAIAPANEGGGGFAVQLAAPGSEADAKSTSSRLAAKYADALGGRHLGFHKAESNGRSVYRVRVGSLSKADATSLCDKLKADGGTCFVAKN